MSQDHLILIQPGFVRRDRAAGERFACPDCNLLEGLLATAPEGAAQGLRVSRVPFERPRQAVIELLGEKNQGLPVLLIGDAAKAPPEARWHEGQAFVDDPAQIARWLARQHGLLSL
ncbi:MAG: DUF3088 family protein [Curvibacter sp.]|nr:DUF3088 family protein [Curvibacter sp.]